ncbi:MAG: M20 family metallopeptidase [Armatimonadetes bacterium]|nr:M20 family metallopeptidase [Armatimonadota bacterium]
MRIPAEIERLARRAVEAVDAEFAVSLTRDLVRIPSVYRPDVPAATEKAVALFLAGVLEGLGMRVAVEEAAPGRPNVVGDWQCAPGGPLLILEGHTDVVTEGDPAAWTHPPFEGVVVDGRLYGRGAADMKGGLAAAVTAVKALRDAGIEIPGTIRLAVVVDEEGMMAGIKDFIRRGWARGAAAALICEPEENEVCLCQKGAIRALARFRGRMAHGAMPREGVNPLFSVAEFLLGVRDLDRMLVERHGVHDLLGCPSATPTIVRAPDRGEAQLNVLPGDALVALDLRTIPGMTHEAVVVEMQALLERIRARHPGVQSALEVIEERPWTQTPREAPLVRAVEAACEMVTGRPPRHGGVPGSTDGTFLHAWAGVPIVTIGPGNRTIPHQVDEYVEVEELVTAARIYAASAILFLGAMAENGGA